MSKVVRCIYEYGGVACPERNACKDGPDPMYWRHASPSKPQLSDRDQNSGDANDADHGFRRYFASLRVFLMRLDQSSKQRLCTNNDETPY